MKGIILFIIAFVFILLAFVVGFRNSEVVTINALVIQGNLQISTFMVICIGIGFFLGFVTIFTKYLALKIRLSSMRRRLEKLSSEKR